MLWEPYTMKKIAAVFASASLMALAACGEKPANETANASNAVVENVVENAANAAENAANAADNAANVANNAANAM
ncbi:hypothetical protein SBA_ch1_23390 [Sphingomonas bisphenolicum]|uniref:Circumsporozoite protein n=2 Tax=Alphaproteobacteria TaxID=28211 RepID=A0ABM7G557_9SPHN|nr:hypothetical protein SBA_ch1_23390 [Sphingomonas bisphenolicum]